MTKKKQQYKKFIGGGNYKKSSIKRTIKISIPPKPRRQKEDWSKINKKTRKEYTRILKPAVSYTSEFDMFYVGWGNRNKKKCAVHSTIEANVLDGEGNIRFDVTKNGNIVGIEIEDLKNLLKRADCDCKSCQKKKLK